MRRHMRSSAPGGELGGASRGWRGGAAGGVQAETWGRPQWSCEWASLQDGLCCTVLCESVCGGRSQVLLQDESCPVSPTVTGALQLGVRGAFVFLFPLLLAPNSRPKIEPKLEPQKLHNLTPIMPKDIGPNGRLSGRESASSGGPNLRAKMEQGPSERPSCGAAQSSGRGRQSAIG